MKDSVVRGCLLQLLYERRSEGSIPFGRLEQAVPPPGGISHGDWLHAVAQLSEYGLIDWTPLEDQSGMGLLSGFAKINDFGVKVLEAGVASPIADLKSFTDADCHVTSNPHVYRTPATDSRRSADPTSRMGQAKWRISHVRFVRDVSHGNARHFDAKEIQRVYRSS